jgi:HlyD family secretion protein
MGVASGKGGKMKRVSVIAALFAIVVAGGLAYWWLRPSSTPKEIVVYGNVDLRQVDLPFNGTERIAAVLVQEGDRVHRGQMLARLETSRLEPQVAQAQAQVAAQQAVVDRLHHGSRPEEIAQARAALESAKADAENARRQAERFRGLIAASGGRAASQQDLDNANAQLDVANAKAVSEQKALDLAVAGPRKEDVAQAEAQLQAEQAQLALLKAELADANLLAPTDAVIRSRLMEPGEMASPQKPVFSLAITDPKWVRAYISETDLGKIRSGELASVGIDSFPNRRFEGWIGFISPVAEFTPKTVQTEELRTSLVYEIRVFVKDPDDQLRLGMPATVFLPLTPGAPAAGKSAS